MIIKDKYLWFMNNVKWAYFDLDGTLIPDGYTLSKENINAIEYLKSKGIKVGIVTGRSWYLTELYAKMLQTNLPIVCLEGGWIIDIDHKTFIYNPIDFTTQKNLLTYFEKNQINIYVTFQNGFYCINSEFKIFEWLLNQSDLINQINKDYDFKSGVNNNYQFYLNKPWLKIYVQFNNQNHKNEILSFLKQFKTLDIFAEKYLIVVSNFYANKALGIRKAMELEANRNHIVNASNIAIFGDDYNDLCMFRMFNENSVALVNGINEVKSIAKHVTSLPCNENGAADFIFKHF